MSRIRKITDPNGIIRDVVKLPKGNAMKYKGTASHPQIHAVATTFTLSEAGAWAETVKNAQEIEAIARDLQII